MFVHLSLTISISKIACGTYMIHESCSVQPTNKWSWQLHIALACCHLPACLTMFLTAWYQTLTDASYHQLECYLHPRKCRVQKECDRLLSTKRNKQFCNQSNVGHGAYQYLHIFTLIFFRILRWEYPKPSSKLSNVPLWDVAQLLQPWWHSNWPSSWFQEIDRFTGFIALHPMQPDRSHSLNLALPHGELVPHAHRAWFFRMSWSTVPIKSKRKLPTKGFLSYASMTEADAHQPKFWRIVAWDF